jgi:hypothetical protein
MHRLIGQHESAALAEPTPAVAMPYKPDPANDPNEIYAVIPTPAELGGPTDWWTVTAHGVPVWHFPPDKRDLAERFATDPAYRQQLTNKKGV